MVILPFFLIPLAALLIWAFVFDVRRRRLGGTRSREEIGLDRAKANDMLKKNKYGVGDGGGTGGM
jgi:hypothetical protein